MPFKIENGEVLTYQNIAQITLRGEQVFIFYSNYHPQNSVQTCTFHIKNIVNLSLKFLNSSRQLANHVRDAQIVTYVVSFTPNTTRLREGMSEALLLPQELSCVSLCALLVNFLLSHLLTSFLSVSFNLRLL